MIQWENLSKIKPQNYICGICGADIWANDGYYGIDPTGHDSNNSYIYICHHCWKPTFYCPHTRRQIPGPVFGEPVGGIEDKDIDSLYTEARLCISSNAFTASVLCCRKILMHIAVEKGADEGLKFIQYIEYLDGRNYIPPDGREWVDYIRKKGNDANHEIIIMTMEDAKDLVSFTGMLLKIIYEFPSKVKVRAASKKEGAEKK